MHTYICELSTQHGTYHTYEEQAQCDAVDDVTPVDFQRWACNERTEAKRG